MQKKIINEVLKHYQKDESGSFDQETIDFLTDKINKALDIPLINEDVEEIIINSVLRIIFKLLLSKTDKSHILSI